MNYIKLNELAAQAMGMDPNMDYLTAINTGGVTRKWNPCEDLNDASALLEKVADGHAWEIFRGTLGHGCKIHHSKGRPKYKHAWAMPTAALAVTVTCLRASGIPESFITEAQE